MSDPWQVPLPPELAGVEEPFTDDELAEAVEAAGAGPYTDEAVPEPVRSWMITDDAKAEWAARKWRAAHDEAARILEQAAEWRRRIDEWERSQKKRAEGTMGFFGAHLEAYAIAKRLGGGEATLRLPSAQVRTTSHKAKPVIVKPDEFMAWALENAPVLTRRADPEPARSEFKDHLEIRTVLDYSECDGRLECGHEVEFRLLPTDDPEKLVFGCGACEPDPIDGPPKHPLVSWGIRERVQHRAVFLKASGVEVPGMDVESEVVTAKVGA